MAVNAGFSTGGDLGTLFLRISANSADLVRMVGESKAVVEKGATSMSNSFMGASKSMVALYTTMAVGFGVVLAWTKHVMKASEEMGNFSEQVGIAIGTLSGLKFAAEKANLGEQFTQGMKKFSQALVEGRVAGSEMAAMFKAVDVDPNQETSKALLQMSDRFKGWKDGAEKAGVAMEFFGLKGTGFINFLNQGSEGLEKEQNRFRELIGDQNFKKLNEMIQENSATVVEFVTVLTGLTLTFLEQVLPAINELTKYIVDNMAQFQSWGIFVADAAKAIGQAFLGAADLVMMALRSLIGGWYTLISSLMEAISDVVTFVGKAVSLVMSAAQGAVNLGIKGINLLLDAIPDWVKEQFGIGGGSRVPLLNMDVDVDTSKVNKFFDDLKDQWQEDADLVNKDLVGQLQPLYESVNKEAKGLTDETKKTGDAVKKTLAPNVAQVKKDFHEINQELEKTKNLIESEFDKVKNKSAHADARAFGMAGSPMLGLQNRKDEMEKTAKEMAEFEKHTQDMDLKEYSKYEAMKTRVLEEQRKERAAINREILRVSFETTSKMFEDMETIAEAFGGKQSGAYKAMFAASKAFAVAEATVKILQGIAGAAAAPWPANLAAMASVVAATASIVTSIQAVKLEFAGGGAEARRRGGYVTANKPYMVGEEGQELFVPSGNGFIVPHHKLGPATRVVVNNYTDARPEITERNEGDQKVVEVLLRRVRSDLANDVRNGTGELSKTMERSYGLRRGIGAV